MTADVAVDESLALRDALAGRYEVEKELGRGGMGIVYLARDLALERPVAIKLLPPGLAAQPELRQRFLREIRTAAGLSHPNIVPIYSVEEHDGLVFYAMGYVDGETLTQRVRRSGPLPPGEAARVLQEAAWALSYAHGRGIVHRDVKPDNILIERATGRTFLTDFGIAHIANSTMTAVGVSLGTPQFMSPEQAAGEELDGRCDIYSLGVVGYVALTGKVPFDAPTVQAILAMHLTEPPPPLDSLRPGLPAKLAAAVERCLAKDRVERWSSAEELTTALQVTQTAMASEVAPQVRSFQRFAESQVTHLFIVVSVIPIMILARPEKPVLVILWVLATLVVVAVVLRGRARLLLRQGFTYEDMLAALVIEEHRRQEEREAFDRGIATVMPSQRRSYALFTVVGIALLAGGVALARHSHIHSARGILLLVMITAGALIVVLAIGMRTGRLMGAERREHRLARRLWRGWLGRALFWRLE